MASFAGRWATSPCGTRGSTSSEASRLLGDQLDPRMRKRLDKSLAKARSRDHLRALTGSPRSSTATVGSSRDPPLVVPVSELAADLRRDEVDSTVQASFSTTPPRSTPAIRELVGSYSFVDMARKAVGGRQRGDPLLDRADART